jgi:hypothetical protein
MLPSVIGSIGSSKRAIKEKPRRGGALVASTSIGLNHAREPYIGRTRHWLQQGYTPLQTCAINGRLATASTGTASSAIGRLQPVAAGEGHARRSKDEAGTFRRENPARSGLSLSGTLIAFSTHGRSGRSLLART